MAVQAWLFMDASQKDAAEALNVEGGDVAVIPRVIDNSLANNLGDGDIDNDHYVCPARLLNDSDYTAYYSLCSTFPIRTWDSDVLFMPDPGI